MSKYTTEVRYICENYASLTESKGYDDVADILDDSWDKVFSFDFPIFDEEYRPVLCKKILKHYYTREICEETVGLWKLRLDARMNEIMPYFNKLYESESLTIDPLVNYRYRRSGQNKKTGSDGISGSNNDTETRNLTTTGTKTGTVGNNIVKSGNETIGKAGTEDETKTGKMETTEQGKIIDTRTGKGETTERYKGKGGLITDNTTDLFTDTPQGNIDNMGDNYGTQQNPSDVPIVGSDTSYLTTAEKTLNSREDKSEWEKGYGFGKDSDGNDFEDVRTRQFGEQPEQGEYEPYTKKEDYGSGNNGLKTSKTFTNRLDTKTYNNVTTNGTTTYGTTDTTMETGTKGNVGTYSKTTNYGSIDDYLENITGSRGISDSKLLKEFRETFLNIDEMIIARLKDLFIYLW